MGHCLRPFEGIEELDYTEGALKAEGRRPLHFLPEILESSPLDALQPHGTQEHRGWHHTIFGGHISQDYWFQTKKPVLAKELEKTLIDRGPEAPRNGQKACVAGEPRLRSVGTSQPLVSALEDTTADGPRPAQALHPSPRGGEIVVDFLQAPWELKEVRAGGQRLAQALSGSRKYFSFWPPRI